MTRTSRNVLLGVCVALMMSIVSAQMMGMGKKEKKIIPARKEDLKYMKCAACEMMVKQTVKITKEKKAESKGKGVEAEILDSLELMCNPDIAQGEWLNNLTINHVDDKLKVVDMGRMGQCDVECRTIARACNDILEDTDLTDYSPMLVRGASRKELSQFMCYDSTSACGKKIPAVPKDRAPGKGFKAMDDDEVQRYRMLRTMKENGMSGTMYDRESIMDEMEMLKEEMGDDFPEDFEQDLADVKQGAGAEMESGEEPDSGLAYSSIGKAAEAMKDSVGKVVSGVADGAKRVYNRVVGGDKKEL